ncbi:unnamed protein product [Psylliodes chrysocephalus]|uniref:Transposase n=1 Tax=Psylliodes chrysocephalus TaxID=3402493 RepID=A0A9P0D1V1_9CUCU|nr:unnamed protein product [Psylliodes chrysocephala]
MKENPHAITETHFQEQFSVNVWAGIISNHLLGPFFLPGRLDGQSYLHFLEEKLRGLLEDVPIPLRNQMWFMHDGAPAHFSLIVRNHLNTVYPGRCIGRGGSQKWPVRSPNLNSLDLFLWGHLKTLMYQTPVNTVEDYLNECAIPCEDGRKHAY